MHWAIPLSLFLSVAGFAKAPKFDESKVAELLKPLVLELPEPMDTYHWEHADSDYAKKFKADDPRGLFEMTRASARSYLDDDGKHGLYLALDPASSRNYGGQNWRLVQVQAPAGFRYLDLREQPSVFNSDGEGEERNSLLEKLQSAMPGEKGEACARAILLTFNRDVTGTNDELFGDGTCARFKRRVFRKLGISGIRYHWQRSRMNSLCPGRDTSAFVITESGWIKPENVRGFTQATGDYREDRAAIQEILRRTRSIGGKPRPFEQDPLWKDLPPVNAKGAVSRATKQWMKEHVVNCRNLQLEPVPVTHHYTSESTDDDKVEITNAPAE